MKVYILAEIDYDVFDIEYVTTSLEKANEFHKVFEDEFEHNLSLIELSLDSLPKYKRSRYDKFIKFMSYVKTYSIGSYTFTYDAELDEVVIHNGDTFLFSTNCCKDFRLKSAYFKLCRDIKICDECGKPVKSGYVDYKSVQYCCDEELIKDAREWRGGSELRKIGEHKYEWKPFSCGEWEELWYEWKDSFEQEVF